MDARLNDAAWLRAAYRTKTTQQIGEELNCARRTVERHMRLLDIPRRKRGTRPGTPQTPEHRAKIGAASKRHWETLDRVSWGTALSAAKRRGRTLINKEGYELVYVPGRGRMLAHRAVMEAAMGRRLGSEEIVHHRDGDRLNNDLDNLMLTDQSGHMIEHGRQRAAMRSETHKRCTRCAEWLPRTDFRVVPNLPPHRDQHFSWCRACCRVAHRERRHRLLHLSHPE